MVIESLWKRTSGEGSPFVNLLENVESVASITGVIDAGSSKNFENTQKGNELSNNYRSEGNEKFVMRKFMDAMSLYNKSLCFAENDSENIALAYGNRSACFFHLKEYKKCLTDISLAMDQECPEHLLSKLVKRREDCEKEIASGNNIEEYRPEIRSAGNEAFPECSADLRIQNSESMGRCVVSCVDIPAGETVIIEEALFGHPGETRYRRCAACSKLATNFTPCRKCTSAVFCHPPCCDNYDIHKRECEYYINDSNKLELHLEFIAHSIYFAINIFPDIESLMAFVESAVKEPTGKIPSVLNDKKSKYRAFLQLGAFVDPKSEEKFLGLASDSYKSLITREFIRELFDTEEKQSFLVHLILQHVVISPSNAIISKIGGARFLFILSSYFNHSCEPNVSRVNQHNRMMCLTIRPIRAGEQLYVRYNEEVDGKTVVRRQELFKLKYGFQCKCKRCESSVPSHLIEKLTSELASHPGYQFVLREIRKSPDLRCTMEELLYLHENCVELLNYFGERWTPAYSTLSSIFTLIYKKMLSPLDENVGFNFP